MEVSAPLGLDLASDVRGVLADETRTVRKQRDELRLAIEYITISPDKSGLDVAL